MDTLNIHCLSCAIWNHAISKVNLMLGFIKQYAKVFRNINAFKVASLMYLHLEYASHVWSLFYKNHIYKIKRVQQKFV